MDLSEFSGYVHKRVHKRISEIDPENAKKIIGFLLLHDHSDQEMAQLALGSDHDILEIVNHVKNELQRLLALSSMLTPTLSPSLPRYSWDQQPTLGCLYPDAEYQNSSASAYVDNAAVMPRHHSATVLEFQPKICHYYSKGHCKHGNACRYLHSIPETDHLRLGSLEKLEFEIVDLLKSRSGNPISIASLPMIYFDKYGRNLQAEGYLTESQRHGGKSCFSLTNLLARFKTIQVIDRPHGQHSVILTQDASKFMDHRIIDDPGTIVSSSARQIYLTFPADSIFTEDDVSEYFSAHYGMVEDVRIPWQQRRMFGFVTFRSIETVNQILSQDNEHLICGARVLVKPYREKLKLERKNQTCCTSHYNNLETEQLHSMVQVRRGGYEASRILRRIKEQQQEEVLEVERRFSEMSLKAKPVISRPYFNYQMKELQVPEEHFSFPIEERFDHVLDALKTGSGSGSCSGSCSMTADNKPVQNLNLLGSPFESITGSSN